MKTSEAGVTISKVEDGDIVSIQISSPFEFKVSMKKFFVKKIKWTKLLSYYWYIINIKPCKITLHIYLNYTSINTKALYIEYKVSAVAYHN